MSSLPSSAFSFLPAVVVSGAAGFVGRRVVARLAAAGGKVLAVDRMEAPSGWPDQIEYRRMELGRDMPSLGRDWILVHLAWHMDRGNVAAQSASVVDFTRLLGQEGLVGVVGLGSAEEYGELEGKLSEDRVPQLPLPLYGQAKQVARRALQAWSRGTGRKAIWLRPFIAYGPGQVGNMAIPYALRCAQDRQTAEFSEGLQCRDFVHVDDVADGIARSALMLPGVVAPFSVCNLGRGEPVRLRDVLDRIAEKTASRELFRFGARPMRSNEPREQYADVAASERLLGWRARISWQQGIDELCKGIAP